MKFYTYILLLLAIAIPQGIFASELRINPVDSTVNQGEFVFVDIELNATEAVNAFSGDIVFDSEYLQLDRLLDGTTIISNWIERPELIEGNKIRMAGIITGGWYGTEARLLRLVFMTKKEGVTVVKAESLELLRHDGVGSEAQIIPVDAKITITGVDDGNAATAIQEADVYPPSLTFHDIVTIHAVDGKRRALITEFSDSEGGVESVQVSVAGREWEDVLGPYIFDNSWWRREVLVKAVDRSGNEEVFDVGPVGWLTWWHGIVVVIIIYLCFLFIRKK